MQRILNAWLMLRQSARKATPYLLLAIVMPGGILLAPLLYFHQRDARARGLVR